MEPGFLKRLLFDLAPDGVYHASDVTIAPVSSYLAVSPLPQFQFASWQFEGTQQTAYHQLVCRGGLFSVALSLRSPSVAVSDHPSTVEPGLSSP